MPSFSEQDPYNKYVQGGMGDGTFSSAVYTSIAAGPPRINTVGTSALSAGKTLGGALDSKLNNIVYPVGLLQNFSLQHNKQVNRLFEIGSERSYHITGRSQGQISLGRAYYHGASLLRTLYAYYQDRVGVGPEIQPMFENIGNLTNLHPHDVQIPPGFENIWLNLASDIFSQPFGLLLYIRDIHLSVLGAGYFEGALIPNHGFGFDAAGVMMQEQCSCMFERLVPVAVTSVALITDGDGGGSLATYSPSTGWGGGSSSGTNISGRDVLNAGNSALTGAASAFTSVFG
jgi:hypothetical protein